MSDLSRNDPLINDQLPQDQLFIAVDWGTSSLRAFLCKVDGDKTLSLIARTSGLGVNKVVSSFEHTLHASIKDWVAQHGKLPIFMAGQIGSSIGWHETDYLHCPISPKQVASRCLVFASEGHQISIVPGLSCLLPNQNHDVMRGEELQVLGWLVSNSHNRVGSHLLCLPGTHTKWVWVKDGEIILFKTAMTGELYDLLVNHSVVIQNKTAEFDMDAFIQGAKFTLQSEAGSLVHGLFSVRSKQLFDQISPAQSTSYLSGILIGSDARAAINAREWDFKGLNKIAIIGAPHLSTLFAKVLALEGYKTEICDEAQTTLAGFSSLFNRVNRKKESDPKQ